MEMLFDNLIIRCPNSVKLSPLMPIKFCFKKFHFAAIVKIVQVPLNDELLGNFPQKRNRFY